jgi:lipopolysaccharide/colanic/teichoic acid biosynthesis glycosyltransferase
MTLRILYIGSSPDLFEVSERTSEFTIISVRNSREAIQVLKNNIGIDAVISDYNLPGSDGLFLYELIKTKFKKHRFPFILLQEEYSSNIFEKARTIGVTDYYVKRTTLGIQILDRILSLVRRKDSGLSKNDIEKDKKFILPISKRIFDIAFASITLLLAAPFLLLIMLAIRLESKGKVYYTAKRVGRKTFDFYKLRSMSEGSDALLNTLAENKNQYNSKPLLEIDMDSTCPECEKLSKDELCSPKIFVDNHQTCEYWFMEQKKAVSEQSSTFIKIQDDPRITKVGKIIRNTSIDELPQLINVIKGDMSIVGNRPLPVYEAEMLTEDVRSKRFLAPAGITGLWQVELRGKSGNMSEEERVQFDNKYADYFTGNNYSFWLDLKIILRTIPALMQKSTV